MGDLAPAANILESLGSSSTWAWQHYCTPPPGILSESWQYAPRLWSSHCRHVSTVDILHHILAVLAAVYSYHTVYHMHEQRRYSYSHVSYCIIVLE